MPQPLKVISQQPPGGRCTLYTLCAEELSSSLGLARRVVHTEYRDAHGEGSPALLLKAVALQPADGVILSPPKSNLILPGITYDVIAEIAQAAGLPLEFRDISESEVRTADEIWVTSSSKEVLAIVLLDGKPVAGGKPGPVFHRVYALYQEFKQKVMRAGKERQAA